MKIIVGEYRFLKTIELCLSQIARQITIGVCSLAIAFALSGCVKYDTGVNFFSLNDGEIVEQIQLGEQLNSFSQNAVNSWVASIEERTRQAQGRIERANERYFKVIIPFHNTRELTTKINRYFNPEMTNIADRSQLNSHLQIDQNNFLIAVRNHLIYEVDLRPLLVTSSDPQLSLAAVNSIDLNFGLQSPWSIKNVAVDGNLAAVKAANDRQMAWKLQPGVLNRIDAIFWLPNPLGIGAILIVILCMAGYYLKYRQLPWQRSLSPISIESDRVNNDLLQTKDEMLR
jgi:Protein of unknown function (DUF3153)